MASQYSTCGAVELTAAAGGPVRGVVGVGVSARALGTVAKASTRVASRRIFRCMVAPLAAEVSGTRRRGTVPLSVLTIKTALWAMDGRHTNREDLLLELARSGYDRRRRVERRCIRPAR